MQYSELISGSSATKKKSTRMCFSFKSAFVDFSCRIYVVFEFVGTDNSELLRFWVHEAHLQVLDEEVRINVSVKRNNRERR